MKIYLDFDGTVVAHEYPEIGVYNEGCFEVIKKLQKAGHEIILNTSRIDFKNGTMEEALYFLEKNKEKIHLPITEYTPAKLTPTEWSWETIELFETIFIDDFAKGIPMRTLEENPKLALVDWDKIDLQFDEWKLYECVPK